MREFVTTPPEIIPFRVGHCSAPARLSRRDAGWGPIRFPAGVVLIRHPTLGDILFDSGYGRAFFDATAPFPERIYRWLTPVTLPEDQHLTRQLARLNARPATVILSHLHADHIAGLFDLPQPPGRVLTSRSAWTHMQAGSRIATLRAGCPEGLRRQLSRLSPDFIEDLPRVPAPPGLDAIGIFHALDPQASLLAVALPGHGHGQFGLFLPETTPKTTRGPAFLIADAAWSLAALRDNAPPPDSTLRRLGDAQAYLQTFTALSALMRARPDISFYPSHCPEAFP
ncbi:MBL fold metallo-hydrolase [Xinfangfangia sp. D13-10-4-6]|uniref:MBL fold metallo-hydrolase n=1 Tax=Pseudogemmobacter hezensis TaxID=2737662 RepID=UPI0015520BB7|nr:MBL fold metallo-hydrolase [Pseudogemmobacter hezensis]NPD16546.1 MBL fold metallo-hydrolase [Pseudogemmobacter hezensis]